MLLVIPIGTFLNIFSMSEGVVDMVSGGRCICMWWARLSLRACEQALQFMPTGSCAVRPQGAEVPNAMSLVFTYFWGVTGGRPTLRCWERGIKLPPPIYLSRNISATPKRRDAKPCTDLPECLAEVVCKLDANPISDDITMTSEINHRLCSSHRRSNKISVFRSSAVWILWYPFNTWQEHGKEISQ